MQQGAVFREGQRIIGRAMRTQNAWERMRGLIGRPALQADQALLIAPCNSIHMLGMHYPIDVAFLNSEGDILKLVRNVRPFCFAAAWHSQAVLELACGEIERLGLAVGERLQWRTNQ